MKTALLLQHNNARPQTRLMTMQHIASLGSTVIPHPPHNLDFASFDFPLFRTMKDGLHGQQFPSNYGIKAARKMWDSSDGADFVSAQHAGSYSLTAKMHS